MISKQSNYKDISSIDKSFFSLTFYYASFSDKTYTLLFVLRYIVFKNGFPLDEIFSMF